MFHKIKGAAALPHLRLSVQFAEGVTKEYNLAPLLDRIPAFQDLRDATLFAQVRVDAGGYGVSWNDDLDLSCDELWDKGARVETPFDNLLSFADASSIWGLGESTLRKAVSYGKITPGTDAQKFGKQWVITRKAMVREYGEPLGR